MLTKEKHISFLIHANLRKMYIILNPNYTLLPHAALLLCHATLAYLFTLLPLALLRQYDTLRGDQDFKQV